MNHLKKVLRTPFRIVLPLLLGGGILWWMYRNKDFNQFRLVLFGQMAWTWMILSFIPGILAQVFRALRWQLALAPLGARPKTSHCIHAIFLSYASSLIVPRSGEFIRCGVLKRYDGVPFATALGAVVTERVVDMMLVLVLVGAVFLSQFGTLAEFVGITGTSLPRFSMEGILVTLICLAALALGAYVLLRRLKLTQRVRNVAADLKAGVTSLRQVKSVWLYLLYSVGIWASYFLHYYFTFFCFGFTEHMGLTAGLVSFCIGTVAVLVPTPNGAGPWHFAVKTILVLYGLDDQLAEDFVLIVHTVQTMLLVVLGLWAMTALSLSKPRQAAHRP